MINNELKGHFLNLYALALSDSHFDERELETILTIGKEKGVLESEFEEIIINPVSIKIEYPSEFTTKIGFLYDFARVIWSDGKVEGNERDSFLKFCERFGFKIDVSIKLFDLLLTLAKDEASK